MTHREAEIIKKIVGKYLKYDFSNKLNNKLRLREYVEARMFYFLITREVTRLPLAIIGKTINPIKDHSTVLHNCNTLKNYLETDARIKFLYKDILNLVLRKLNGTDEIELTHEEQKTKIYNLEKDNEILLKENIKLMKSLKKIKVSLSEHKRYLVEQGYDISRSQTFKILETNNI